MRQVGRAGLCCAGRLTTSEFYISQKNLYCSKQVGRGYRLVILDRSRYSYGLSFCALFTLLIAFFYGINCSQVWRHVDGFHRAH